MSETNITYKPIEKSTSIRVLLNGKAVGSIRNEGVLGFVYIPRAGESHRGEYFPALTECKHSLEADEVEEARQ